MHYSRPAEGRPRPKSFDIAGAYTFPHFCADQWQILLLLQLNIVEGYILPHFCADQWHILLLLQFNIVEGYALPHFCAISGTFYCFTILHSRRVCIPPILCGPVLWHILLLLLLQIVEGHIFFLFWTDQRNILLLLLLHMERYIFPPFVQMSGKFYCSCVWIFS